MNNPLDLGIYPGRGRREGRGPACPTRTREALSWPIGGGWGWGELMKEFYVDSDSPDALVSLQMQVNSNSTHRRCEDELGSLWVWSVTFFKKKFNIYFALFHSNCTLIKGHVRGAVKSPIFTGIIGTWET